MDTGGFSQKSVFVKSEVLQNRGQQELQSGRQLAHTSCSGPEGWPLFKPEKVKSGFQEKTAITV